MLEIIPCLDLDREELPTRAEEQHGPKLNLELFTVFQENVPLLKRWEAQNTTHFLNFYNKK